MISIRPYRNGVFGLILMAGTPFLFAANSSYAANNPIAVESLSNDGTNLRKPPPSSAATTVPGSSVPGATVPGASPVGSGSRVIEYQAPIEDNPRSAEISGFETQYRLQILQQEVQELRGLVEELTYQLKRTEKTQEDRYLELDSRLQGLQVKMGSNPRPTAGISPPEIADVTTEPTIPSTSKNEKGLYETALELIRNRQYDLAITQLRAVIDQYPRGDFTANAYYWLGEVNAAKPVPDYEQARDALAQVITFFPNNPKVPDAAFKLGKVYHLMGDCKRAREILNQVVRDHQGRSVAKLAESYLREMATSCPG